MYKKTEVEITNFERFLRTKLEGFESILKKIAIRTSDRHD